jgi:photosystem II stability/assembly factor-like uncharacterized protein
VTLLAIDSTQTAPMFARGHMKLSITLRGAAALLLVCGRLAAAKTPTPRAPLPFTLTWVKGTCGNCKIAKQLAEVQFVAPDEAWAVGFPVKNGRGDYSVLHSRDGGKSWTEIPEPPQHSLPPSISFFSQAEGWLRVTDFGAGDTRLLWTRDGGGNWRRLPMRDPFVQTVRYLGSGIGFGLGYARQGYLVGTRDLGSHWNKSLLPEGFRPDLMDFVSDRSGFVTGCLGGRPVVTRTLDGGAHWETHVFESPRPTSPDLCASEVYSLDFIDAKRGWVLVSNENGLSEREHHAAVLATEDGGASWKPLARISHSSGRDEVFVNMRFLDDRLGFIWNKKVVENVPSGALRYTTDGGRNWNLLDLPQPLGNCQRYGGSLECTAGGNGFQILRIAPVGTP